MQPKTLIVGHLCLDTIISYKSKRVFFDIPGGNALGSSIGAALWSKQVAIVSRVGEGFSQSLIDSLEESLIDVTAIERTKEKNLKFLILQELDSRFLSFPSNNFEAMFPPIDNIFEHFPNVVGVHIAPIPFEQQYKIAKFFKKQGVFITLDSLPLGFMSSKTKNLAILKKTLSYVDVFLPTWHEISHFFNNQTIEQAAVSLSSFGPKIVIIKTGEQGSVAFSKPNNSFYNIPSYEVKTVESSGAGDAFCGGFLAKYIQTEDIHESIYCGTVSASFMVEDFGVLQGLNKQIDAKKRLDLLLKNNVAKSSNH